MGVLHTEQIYEALFDEEAFARLPQLLAAAVGARSAILFWVYPDGEHGDFAFSRVDPEMLSAYNKTWQRFDPWLAAGLQPARINTFFLAGQAVPDLVFAESAFYNDFMRAYGNDTFHCLAGAFASPGGNGILGLHRGRHEADFGTSELELLQSHALVLGRVLRLRGEIAAARHEAAMAQSALDGIALAVLVADRDGRLRQSNALGDEVLRRADGLVWRRGRIDAVDRFGAAKLHEALRLATAPREPTATSVVIDRGKGLSPYLVAVAPLTGTPLAGHALLIFRDPDTSDRSLVSRLRAMFALGKAEAEVAAALAQGSSPAEIAAHRGVEANTLKSQLAAVMAKMGCHRQSEVAAVVAGLPPIRNR